MPITLKTRISEWRNEFYLLRGQMALLIGSYDELRHKKNGMMLYYCTNGDNKRSTSGMREKNVQPE